MKQNRQLCSVPANHPRIGTSAPFSDRHFNVLHGRIHVLLEIYGQGNNSRHWRTISNSQSCYSTTVVPFFIMTQLFSVLVCTQTFLMEISTRKLCTIKSKIGILKKQNR